MSEFNFSLIAAELGRRGGKVSKRGPGSLRRVLEEVCNEIKSTSNRDVFDYWQKYEVSAEADNAQIGTCWMRYCIRAYPLTDNDPGLRFNQFVPQPHGGYFFRDLPEPWVDKPHDSEYVYKFFDGSQEQETNARRLREAMARIRKAVKNPCNQSQGNAP